MAGHGSVTIDFGTSPVTGAMFTVTDANITAGMTIEPFMVIDDSVAGATGNSAQSHLQASQGLKLAAGAGAAGSFPLLATSTAGGVFGKFKIRYAYTA